MPYEPPPDIADRIEQDFGRGAIDGIRDILQPVVEAGLGDRIVRCILWLAEGDPGKLRHYAEQAVKDYRDVISWAEYDSTRRTHEFNEPFERSSLG